MFSGIIECVAPVLSVEEGQETVRLKIAKPQAFNDLKEGDSIATDGVCLTLENFTQVNLPDTLQFTLGIETLKVIHFKSSDWKSRTVNLERSIRFGDRVHGHLVTGHVDGIAKILKSESSGDCWLIDVEIRDPLLTQVWKKGSIALNGVSLTVNEVVKLSEDAGFVSVCLIPETIARTNLSHFKVGQFLNCETDYLAKAMTRTLKVGATTGV